MKAERQMALSEPNSFSPSAPMDPFAVTHFSITILLFRLRRSHGETRSFELWDQLPVLT